MAVHMIQPEALHQLIYDHVYMRYGHQLAFTIRALLNAKERGMGKPATSESGPSALELLVTYGFTEGDSVHIKTFTQYDDALLVTGSSVEPATEAPHTHQDQSLSQPIDLSSNIMGDRAIDMVVEGKRQLRDTCMSCNTGDSDRCLSISKGHPAGRQIASKIVPSVNATELVLMSDATQTQLSTEEFYPVPATTISCEFKPLSSVYLAYHDIVATENVLQNGKLGPTPFSYFYDRTLKVDSSYDRAGYMMYPACSDHWIKHKHSGNDPLGSESTDEYSQPDDPGRIVYTYDYDNDNILNSTFEIELHSFAQVMQEMGSNPMGAENLLPVEKPAVALGDQYATVTPTSPQAHDDNTMAEVEFTADDEGAMDNSTDDQAPGYVPVGDNMDPDLIDQRVLRKADSSLPDEDKTSGASHMPEIAFESHIAKKIEETERAVTPYVVRKQSAISHRDKDKQYIVTGDTMRADVLQQIYKGETTNSKLLDLVGFYNIPLYYGLYSEFKGLHEMRFKKGAVLAGRYEIYKTIFEDSAFSVTLKARDLKEGKDVCLKVVNNEKDTLDQCLNEIRLLTYINKHDPTGKHFVRMTDYFYYGHRLIIIFELLTSNLFSYYSAREATLPRTILNPLATIFTMPRLQHIARQILESLDFLHRLNILHLDLKHENLLLVNEDDDSFDIRLVDIGSSAFLYDECSTYVQSRSYRCPEVILGLPYDGRADVWSLGPILTELITGKVMFPIPQKADEDHKPYASMLAKLIGIIGPIPRDMILAGRESHKLFTKDLFLFETREAILGNRDRTEGLRHAEIKGEDYVYVLPKKTTIKAMLGWDSHPEYCDDLFLDFIETIMRIDPRTRPTAAEALEHPWFKHVY
ncbi:Serine/threonine protein kinase [Giardia duodenalis]|uniref:Serine/threonine protein kinase n=2 Tax=Giardia intestinalis TaxID=5741 RepID=V6U439_GIAIN|nr:Serine/threonine protein kinase [Giardia intestinalis]